jgi:hypothetical protein
MRILVILAAFVWALPVPARAQTVQKIFQEFGLIGAWANSCGATADATAGNYRSIYALSRSDGVMLTYDTGPKYEDRVYSIVSAKRLARDRLSYVQEQLDGKSRATVTVRKQRNGAIAVWSSVTQDGKVLVKDGKFAATGQQSPRQARCPI